MEPVKSRPPTEDGGLVGVCPNSRQLELIAMTVVGELEMGIEGIGDTDANSKTTDVYNLFSSQLWPRSKGGGDGGYLARLLLTWMVEGRRGT